MKEKIKRFFASIAAIILAVGMMGANVTPVMAEDNGSITITPPTGVTETQDYKIYRVFQGVGNGTNISYKLLDGQTTGVGTAWETAGMGTYFEVDTAGNVSAKDAAIQKDAEDNPEQVNGKTQLTNEALTAIGNYVKAVYDLASENPEKPTYTATKNADTGKYVATGVADGYYYITTTTGSVVMIDSANHSVDVTDKNSVPEVTKEITGVGTGSKDKDTAATNAIAQVGSTVSYSATVTFGKGSKNVKFHDSMENSLSLIKKKEDGSSAFTVAFKDANGEDVATGTYTYTIKAGEGAATGETDDPATGDTFTVEFQDGIPEGYKAIISYSATVTDKALSKDPATNTAKVTFGDKNDTTQESKTNVYNAKITVNKTFQGLGDADTLANNDSARFVLTKQVENGDTAGQKKTVYYKYDDNSKSVSWVDNVSDATYIEFKKNNDNTNDTFYGLADGDYTLVESKVPDGYNKAADTEITINQANADKALETSNLEQSTNITNNQGSLLPSTGGIGTTIFYVIGGVVIAGAVILLIARRRKNA